ncbi:30S ribosomal protein S1 [compost metagenome]
MEEGIDGLIYISDLSWTKKIKHPSEFCAVGDKLDVIVLELDTQARRLSLGHKQLTENPWDKFETKYAEGTVHAGKATEVHDKGASIQFEDVEVEAFCPSRLLEKEDGSKIKKGDDAQFKVIEFNKEFKRVVVSHTGIFRDEEKKNVRDNSNRSNNNSNTSSSSNNEEKSTLGDIDVLAELKRKMEEGN